VGLFDMTKGLPLFKTHLRDFVVQMKEFENADNSGLYEEETQAQRQGAAEAEQQRIQSVPGLLPPSQALPDEMADEL
jgi:exportin-1